MNKTPDALVIGPMKAGTTWIDSYLRERGDVCLPQGVKETMFFDHRFERGVDWYLRHFKGCESVKRTVEVAPGYFHHREAPARIKETLGIIPLVCSLRDPAKRSYSLYLHMRRYGMTYCKDFRSAVDKHPEILTSSFYATHLERWIDIFGRENILVLFQDDLANHQTNYVQRLCEHLDLSYIQPSMALNARINAAALPMSPVLAAVGQRAADLMRTAGLYQFINLAKKIGLKSVFFGRPGKSVPKLRVEERKWILEKLAPEIERLERILECDLSHWRQS